MASPVRTKTSRRRTLLAFAPALVVIGITAAVASGVTIIPGATAANSLTLNGSVTAGMSVTSDTSGAGCGSGTLSIGDFSDGAFHQSGATCALTFATNSPNGAQLTVQDGDSTAPFFCTSTCGVGTNQAVENATTGAGGTALGNDQFGLALVSTAGTPSPVAGTNYEIDPTPGTQTGAELIWAPVGAASDTICETGALTTVNQTCTMTFAADGQGASQTSGAYTGTATLVATAKP